MHVGATEHGDVHEAELLRAAVEGRGQHGSTAASRMAIDLHVHPNRNHNLVIDLRDTGELHHLLRRWLQPTAAPDASPAPAAALAAAATPTDAPPQTGRRRPPDCLVAALPDSSQRADAAAASFPTAAAALAGGRELLTAKQPAQALAAFDASLELQPSYADAWAERAKALVALGRFVDAMRNATVAISLLKGDSRPSATRATAIAQRAIQAATEAQHTLSAELPKAMAAMSTPGADRVTSSRAYERICALDPTNVLARTEVCRPAVRPAVAPPV